MYNKPFYPIRPEFLICLLLTLIISAVYFQVRNYEFIDYDDGIYISENPHIHSGLNWKGISWAFAAKRAGNWHPLTWISHMLDVQLYGMNAGGHHLTNVVFHILNTLLLFLLLRRMTRGLWQSAFVAALFALHPLHVESVAWISERKDVLSAFFWMMTMLSYVWYVEHPGVLRYLITVVFFIMGLMSKPMLVTLPFVLLMIDYWPLKRFGFYQSDCTCDTYKGTFSLRLVWEKLPLFVLSIASSVVTYVVQKSKGTVASLDAWPFHLRIENAIISYIAYLGKMLWPVNLALLYPHPETLPWWQIFGSCIILIAIVFLSLRCLKRHPYVAVGWLWYMVTLVPVIGIVQVGMQAMADRYTYIPLIGIYIIIAWCGFEYFKLWRRKVLITVICIMALSVLFLRTWSQISYWADSTTLFKHSVMATTGNYFMHNNLALALASKGKLDQAITHYLEAMKINPRFAPTYNNLGVALLRKGKIDLAIDILRKALSINIKYAKVHNNLGVALMKKNKNDLAIYHFQEAIRLQPDNESAAKNVEKIMANRER